MPACPAGSVQQQVMQQYSYLFQMAQQLNLALERLEQGTGASSGGKGTEQQYRKLRSLIAGGEERLKRAVEELAAQVETEYVAADSFEGQAAALSGRLEAEPEKLGAYYGFAADAEVRPGAVGGRLRPVQGERGGLRSDGAS